MGAAFGFSGGGGGGGGGSGGCVGGRCCCRAAAAAVGRRFHFKDVVIVSGGVGIFGRDRVNKFVEIVAGGR